MNFGPRLRKLVLTLHIASSVGLLGAVAVFLALAVAGLVGEDARLAHAVYPAMDLAARWVILPLALLSLVVGIVQSLGTPWGLLRHYWVIAKFVLTIVATLVLLVQMEPIGILARAAALGPGDRGLQLRLLLHAAGGLLVLLAATTLAVYKPRGMTSYGARKGRGEAQSDGDRAAE